LLAVWWQIIVAALALDAIQERIALAEQDVRGQK